MYPSESSIEIQQRRRMVEHQLRQRGIHNEKVLEVMEQLPRHFFIPAQNRNESYLDQPVSIGLGQTISQPYIVALMTEELKIEPENQVLEIGTGCGYQTAILAKLCRRVYSIEVLEELGRQGRENVTKLDIRNVEYYIGNGRRGWPEPMQFERILVAAATEEVPAALLEQLHEGGKMIVPVDEQGGQKLILLEKHDKKIKDKFICYCRFVRLVHK